MLKRMGGEMSEKDKEEFINWYKNKISEFDNCKEAWQAACEYKQKEIDYLRLEYDKLTDWASEYKAENAKLIEQDKIMSGEIKTYMEIAEKLQAENTELKQKLKTVWKEAEEFYLED